MRARVTIEYDLREGDRVALQEREERRWVTSETLLALPSAIVKVELLNRPSLGPPSQARPLPNQSAQ
jgi:hypothetical protein